jgi:N-carbamoyl-L-amino-acid hydrolase
MRTHSEQAFAEGARAEGCEFLVEPIWSIDPVPFHEGLVEAAAEACAVEAGRELRLPSGALHDASELAAVCPTAMVFSSSIAGVSHSPQEDTREPDLEHAIAAYGALVRRVVEGGVP